MVPTTCLPGWLAGTPAGAGALVGTGSGMFGLPQGMLGKSETERNERERERQQFFAAERK